jgi:tetratricopeptide (TPR) repeat protein
VNEGTLFPSYIGRDEEQQILDEAVKVRDDGKSRAVLLYGLGGVGKTQLVRELARASADDPLTVWLDPIDIDDSDYWLLSNLERLVAERLDPQNLYFEPYLEYLTRLPTYTRQRIGHETVVSHLGRIKRVFVECYTKFIERSGKTVVIVFDTVETIRGMYLLLTLTQWVKALPGTLFILSGRPVPDGKLDPIKNELEDPYQSIPVRTIWLGQFTQEAALDYLNSSGVFSGLTPDEKAKMVRLTRGHPLWLAFTVAYLESKGVPEEAEASFDDIDRDLPYSGEMTPAGQALQEAFKRRLVSPYRETDFWHETVKRLAVVRESVNEPIWRQLMADLPELERLESDEAWETLLQTPWIRPRANRHYVTLHDAVAEELAQRIIPLHDQDEQWRRRLWRQAASLYRELTESREAELSGGLAAVDELLELWDARPRPPEAEGLPPGDQETRLIEEVASLDVRKRELCQLKAVGLYYEILCDFPEGCRLFLSYLEQAQREHDVLFQDLLAFEMQRFMPIGADAHPLGDVIGKVIDEAHKWLLSAEGRTLYLDVGLGMADYLIRDEQPTTAMDLLGKLPAASADSHQRYRLSNLQGNAVMRISGRVREGSQHFRQALEEAQRMQPPDRLKFIAQAYNELGFYYRNEGLWEEADNSYQQARNTISRTLSARSSDDDREEMASIQTNWAYVKGLRGHYRDGTNLVESAISVRHRLKKYQEEGISWSVCGEVYRYERRFQMAWKAYAEAEQIFQGQRNWSWLGMVYQEQAICLFQAYQDGISTDPRRDPVEHAKQLVTLALDLCRDLAVRGQPSALNRAGRIFGEGDFDKGLAYLADGIEWARRLSDGWFWFANLIEYAELSYRAWVATRQPAYRDQIAGKADEISRAMREYEFPDLKGRWNLLQGHLGIHDALDTTENAVDESGLSAALENYKTGFALIAKGYVGSSGAAAVASEFKTFRELVWQLTEEIRAEWQAELRSAWSGLPQGSTLLLARLEELY